MKKWYWLGVLGIFFAHNAWAAFQIVPISSTLSKSKRSDEIRLIWDSPITMNMKVEAFEWTQDEEGENIETPTKDLVVFPRMIRLTDQTTAIIRIGIPKRYDTWDRQRLFKLKATQLPPPEEEKATQEAPAPNAMVKFLFAYNICALRRCQVLIKI